MSTTLQHECLRAPVTALATVGPLLLAAEGPFLRIYDIRNSKPLEFLGSKKIFEDHAIHGIAVHADSSTHAILAVWGGPLVRFLQVSPTAWDAGTEAPILDAFQLSSVKRAPDWILDLSFDPWSYPQSLHSHVAVCAAVTAHNALIKLTAQPLNSVHNTSEGPHSQDMVIHLSELTSSTRSILYSAHLVWDSDRILVAAGTAFGEIILWSWTNDAHTGTNSCLHRVLLGHEGSIFGVRISREFSNGSSNRGKRLLASCSDDRTIRLWDISDVFSNTDVAVGDGQSDSHRSRHTGFSDISLDADSSNSACVAIGWGHSSRVWAVQFLNFCQPSSPVSLLSFGEDSTSRVWQFSPTDPEISSDGDATPVSLVEISHAAYHNGKNIWSTALFVRQPDAQQVICGGADSKISAYRLPTLSQVVNVKNGGGFKGYTFDDLVEISQHTHHSWQVQNALPTKPAKAVDFIRSYAFIDSTSFLLSTNSGKVFLETLQADGTAPNAISESTLVGHFDDISGYSVCSSDNSVGVAFVAGSRGSIYMFRRGCNSLTKIHTLRGKIGNMFTGRISAGQEPQTIVVLVTLMGSKTAQLLYIDLSAQAVTRTIDILLSDSVTGLVITSMTYNYTDTDEDYVFLGFRTGSVVAYSLATGATEATPSFIERTHGKETVTSMLWVPSPSASTTGQLVSVGRDGCIAVHHVNFSEPTISRHHYLPLPIGPNIEGVYSHHGHLVVYGFSSTKFVVYDITTEEEIMSVETGGSHRSWTFQPHTTKEGGGTLIWTRAVSMHICSRTGANHQVIRAGGHGREIKDVAISKEFNCNSSRKLIATGAEDTDIKLFVYSDGVFTCKRTLRKHNTGIQHLAWSDDSKYLFSSGGGEEFCVWRIRNLPSFIEIGVVCESVCAPESAHSDVRITSFDVQRKGDGFVIAMVYSDSQIRVYSYNPTHAEKWTTLARGTYFTSCLTQCVFLSPSTIMTSGTDGHAVLWNLHPQSTTHQPNENLNLSPILSFSPPTTQTLTWHQPTRIHQNTSKSLSTYPLSKTHTLIVSGGDDGSLAFLLASSTPTGEYKYRQHPIVVVRAHASAITACAIVVHRDEVYVLTSGNDQWVKLWICGFESEEKDGEMRIRRAGKVKTNVADVSSMGVLEGIESESESEVACKVIVCGVGMEVLRFEWSSTL